METVYIDYPIYTKRRGSRWAHMMCKDLTRLHAVAAAAGISRNYFEKSNSGWAHYDVRESQVAAAVDAGAVQMSTKEILKALK